MLIGSVGKSAHAGEQYTTTNRGEWLVVKYGGYGKVKLFESGNKFKNIKKRKILQGNSPVRADWRAKSLCLNAKKKK